MRDIQEKEEFSKRDLFKRFPFSATNEEQRLKSKLDNLLNQDSVEEGWEG